MRLVDKLIVKELIGPFINGLLMFMMLMFAVGYLFQATDLLLRGIALPIVMQLVLLSLPEVLTQTFPMAMLLGGLLAFGRLSGDHEMVSLYAAGISFPRTVRAVAVMGAIVSIVAFLWNDYVVPPAKTAFWDIRQRLDTSLQKMDRPISYSINSKAGDGSVEEFVTVDGGFDVKKRTLHRVNIVKYSADPQRRGQVEANIYCDYAVSNSKTRLDQNGLDWTYYNGNLTLLVPDKLTGKIETVSVTDFHSMRSSPQTPTPGKNFEEVLKSDITDSSRKNFRDLQKEIQADRAAGHFIDAQGKEVDLYGKIALPLASIIFGILGAALGCNTQRGGGGRTVGFGMAIFIVFLYYIFYRAMFVVGKNGGLAPILASFLADIVGAVIAIALSVRASR